MWTLQLVVSLSALSRGALALKVFSTEMDDSYGHENLM